MKATREAPKSGEEQPCRGLGALAKCCCYPTEDGEHPRMGDREPKVREESWGPLGPLTVKPSPSLAGECSRPRTKPGLQVGGDEPTKTGVLTQGQHRAGKPGTLTEAIRTSGWISSQSHGKSQWENHKAGSGGSGTKPRYLQGRIRHRLKYNSSVLVGPPGGRVTGLG